MATFNNGKIASDMRKAYVNRAKLGTGGIVNVKGNLAQGGHVGLHNPGGIPAHWNKAPSSSSKVYGGATKAAAAGSKHAAGTKREGSAHSGDQPRVPAGSSDGGQFAKK